jgi:DNA helicase-2/ATP-dependent DNA helicase PcrA
LSYLDQLNPQQREAVESVHGPLLILAGAGSGKTRVITYRIAHLIEKHGVMPESILAVTFTNKAASEMGERVDRLVGGMSIARPVISTFHSFCVRVLRRDIEQLRIRSAAGEAIGLTKNFVIYDESDQESLVKAAMRRLGLDVKELTPRTVLSRISWAKNHMRNPQEVYLNSSDPKDEKIAHVYEIYRRELLKANALDFDDLLLEAARLLKVVPAVREYYNRRFQFVQVDEYQDTNRPQYELMRLLVEGHHNVCVVGDEDQSVYSWRGADIRNILGFEQDFPEAKIIRLEQNYRSTQNILQAASAVVANNVRRKGKNLWTSRQGGTKIGFYEAPDSENEALFVADRIAAYVREARERGEEPHAAVLYRINSQSRLFEEALRRYQLKYHVVGGVSFYDRMEIKDMISYLKVVQNPHDSVSLLRVVNAPTRGIGKTTMETVERVALETGVSLWGALEQVIQRQLAPARAVAALTIFRDLIEDARAMLLGNLAARLEETAGARETESPHPSKGRLGGAPSEAGAADENVGFDPTQFDFGANGDEAEAQAGLPLEAAAEALAAPEEAASSIGAAELLKFLLDRTKYIKQLEDEDTPDSLARVDNLRELMNAAMDSRDRAETLDQFLDHAALVADTDQYDERSQITLMTLHSAKGLEFPLVFLCGLEEGLFPHSRTLLAPDDIEEERRLCYVGMTRAMDTLVLTRARYRRRWGTDLPEASVASRFLEEVPAELIEDVGSPRGYGDSRTSKVARQFYDSDSTHYSYEDEDQSAAHAARVKAAKAKYTGPAYNSISNIAEFFASRGKKFSVPKMAAAEPSGKRGFRPGQKVRHPKYGKGIVYRREGDGEDAKITVQFEGFGLKKLVERYAQLEQV